MLEFLTLLFPDHNNSAGAIPSIDGCYLVVRKLPQPNTFQFRVISQMGRKPELVPENFKQFFLLTNRDNFLE